MKSKAFKAATWSMLLVIGMVQLVRVYLQVRGNIL